MKYTLTKNVQHVIIQVVFQNLYIYYNFFIQDLAESWWHSPGTHVFFIIPELTT